MDNPETSADTRKRLRPKKALPGIAPMGILLAMIPGAQVILMMTAREAKASPRSEKNQVIRLPPPRAQGGMGLAKALSRRRSRREFSSKRLSLGEVGQMCWAAQGITDKGKGSRTAPSAGALYPIRVFVVDGKGVYEYKPSRHVLRRRRAGDRRGKLRAAAGNQPWVGAAPLCLVITMDVSRTASKYGKRAKRYCLLEAGHVAQNVLLQATALGLSGVPVGSFGDRKVAGVLRLQRNLRPVYLVPLGHPPGG